MGAADCNRLHPAATVQMHSVWGGFQNPPRFLLAIGCPPAPEAQEGSTRIFHNLSKDPWTDCGKFWHCVLKSHFSAQCRKMGPCKIFHNLSKDPWTDCGKFFLGLPEAQGGAAQGATEQQSRNREMYSSHGLAQTGSPPTRPPSDGTLQIFQKVSIGYPIVRGLGVTIFSRAPRG
jgi:hypothetical protein